jgi:hypothetical protein
MMDYSNEIEMVLILQGLKVRRRGREGVDFI